MRAIIALTFDVPFHLYQIAVERKKIPEENTLQKGTGQNDVMQYKKNHNQEMVEYWRSMTRRNEARQNRTENTKQSDVRQSKTRQIHSELTKIFVGIPRKDKTRQRTTKQGWFVKS